MVWLAVFFQKKLKKLSLFNSVFSMFFKDISKNLRGVGWVELA